MTEQNTTDVVEPEAPEAPEAPQTDESGEQAEAEARVYTVRTENVPPSWADLDDRQAIADNMAKLREAGWERPMLRELTGFNDSTVYRAQRGMTHFREAQAWFDLFKRIADERLTPSKPGQTAKVKPDEQLSAVQDAVRDAVATLSALGDERSIKNVKAAVDAVVASLTDVVPPVAPSEPEVDEADEAKTDQVAAA